MSERLRGCDLTRVNRQHLTKVVKKMPALQCDTSIESMVAALSDYLIKLHKATPANLLECDYCHGSSDASFDTCPFCGKSDDEAGAAAEAAPPAEEKPLVNARAAKAPKPPKEAKEPASAADGDAPPKRGPGRPPKPKTEVAAITEPKRGPGRPPKPKTDTALAVVHTGELVSTKQLDDAVSEIKEIQTSIVENHWLLGQALGKTWELYKLRMDETNKPKYRNWALFVQAEIEISPRYAMDLVAVSRAFTQEDIREVGVTKLRVLARIPDEAKKQNLLDRAKAELNGKPALSRIELEKEARADGPLIHKGQSLDGRATPESLAKRAETAKVKAAAKGITVVIQPGRVTLPLFAGNAKRSKLARAQDMNDEPQAVEDMLNGIKVRYLITKEEDGLVLVIERVRE